MSEMAIYQQLLRSFQSFRKGKPQVSFFVSFPPELLAIVPSKSNEVCSNHLEAKFDGLKGIHAGRIKDAFIPEGGNLVWAVPILSVWKRSRFSHPHQNLRGRRVSYEKLTLCNDLTDVIQLHGWNWCNALYLKIVDANRTSRNLSRHPRLLAIRGFITKFGRIHCDADSPRRR
jgi:hypothetical protein